MNETNLKLIQALQCAVQVLDGDAGGFSEVEKYNAKVELMALIVREEGR
jgi:hypothetical protein